MLKTLITLFLICSLVSCKSIPQQSFPIHYEPAAQNLIAAHYFLWHKNDNSFWEHCISEPKGGLQPAIGFYDSSDPNTISAQVDQMVEAGIDVVSVEWNGNIQERRNFNTFLEKIEKTPLKFVVMYDSAIRLVQWNLPIDLDKKSIRGRLISDFKLFRLDSRYFKHPNYLRINGKPVVYIYLVGSYVDSNTENSDDERDDIANTFKDLGDGLYIVADILYPNMDGSLNVDRDLLGKIGASAVSSFGPARWDPHTTNKPMKAFADMLQKLYRNASNLFRDGKNGLIDIHPGLFVQFDERGLGPEECGGRGNPSSMQYVHLTSVDDWKYMLKTAGNTDHSVAMMKDGHTNNPDRVSITWIYSWNEWAEGSGLEPIKEQEQRYPYGFGKDLVDALKKYH